MGTTEDWIKKYNELSDSEREEIHKKINEAIVSGVGKCGLLTHDCQAKLKNGECGHPFPCNYKN